MTNVTETGGADYDALYRDFDSPLMQQVRREAYGEDIGQHSWVGADEVRADLARLGLTRTSRLLDLGCGPCGPLTFLLAAVGCRGTGVDASPAALRAGRARAAMLGVEPLLSTHEADLDTTLPFESGAFDAAMSMDVVLHVRDRLHVFQEVARVLRPGGRFLFTDASVVTGAVSNDEVRLRGWHGYTQFAAPGWNEGLLERAGLRLLEVEDRTMGVVRNAGGRLSALRTHRAALEQASNAADVPGQEAYLETVVELAQRGALSRLMYLAHVP